MLVDGKTHAEIVRLLACSKSSVSYHAKKLESRRRGPRPTYDWQAIQAFHDQGHSRAECMRAFRFARATWHKALERGDLHTRDWRIPLADLLNAQRVSQRGHVKSRLMTAGLLSPECAECGITTWCGKPLSLELDHINGDKHDTRLENLRLLCPNCHSQTVTYAGRNSKGLRRHRLAELRSCYRV
jgi:5-methylcytosine-specific restriction endonuclease McrA